MFLWNKKYIFSCKFDLRGWAGDKKTCTRPISGNNTTFLRPNITTWNHEGPQEISFLDKSEKETWACIFSFFKSELVLICCYFVLTWNLFVVSAVAADLWVTHGTINKLEYHVEYHVRKTFIYNSLLTSACLWSRVRLALNKNQKYFLPADYKLSKMQFLFLIHTKGHKNVKGNL